MKTLIFVDVFSGRSLRRARNFLQAAGEDRRTRRGRGLEGCDSPSRVASAMSCWRIELLSRVRNRWCTSLTGSVPSCRPLIMSVVELLVFIWSSSKSMSSISDETMRVLEVDLCNTRLVLDAFDGSSAASEAGFT